MYYEYLYLLLFVYISFEAFYELFLRFGSEHIKLKRKYIKLKEGSESNYFEYRLRILFLPVIYALWSKKVILAIAIYIIHHHFIVELMHRAGTETADFVMFTSVGMWIAVALAVIINAAKYVR